MARQIYIVSAWLVDANGTFAISSGYPKTFDSKNYGGDAEKAYRRADGDMSAVWSEMCKVDTRQVQTVQLSTVDGILLAQKTTGPFKDEEPEE